MALVDYLAEQKHTGWEYYKMSVELDPTVAFNNKMY